MSDLKNNSYDDSLFSLNNINNSVDLNFDSNQVNKELTKNIIEKKHKNKRNKYKSIFNNKNIY